MTQFRNDLAEGVHLCLDLSRIWNGHVHDLLEGFGGIQNQLAEVVDVCPPTCFGTSRPFGSGCSASTLAGNRWAAAVNFQQT